MVVPLAYLVLSPPPWPTMLVTVAAVALAWEAIALVAGLLRRYSVPRALLVALAALVAGPLAALATVVYVAMKAATGEHGSGWGLVAVFLRGTLISFFALLTWWWIPEGAILAIGACAVFWSLRAYARTTAPVRPWVKAALLAARIGVILILSLWALGPADESIREIEVKGIALVGLDTSASMARKDMPLEYRRTEQTPDVPPVPRITALRQALGDQWDRFEELSEQVELHLFTFDSTARTTHPMIPGGRDLVRMVAVDGPATALGDSANKAMEQFAADKRDVVAVLLFSDGCNNTVDVISPEKLAKIKGSQNVPIFTVGVGWDRVTGSTHTLSVRDLSAPKEVEVFNRLPVTATIEAMGLEGREAEVVCSFGETEVAREKITVATGKEAIPLRFVHVPLSAGFQRLRVTAKLIGPEPDGLAGQMTDDRLVRVTNRNLRILYVEGTFRFEKKFIRQALEGAARIQVYPVTLINPVGQAPSADLPGENVEDWMRYHAIILGDVPANAFTERQLAIMRELVSEKGKGFAMLGGYKSFGQGGWADTPIAKVLPVELDKSRGQIDKPIQVVPTEAGKETDLMTVGTEGESVAEAWAKFDVLPGANDLDGVKQAGVVLAETQDGSPLIVKQNYGSGRALAIALDTTWRWVLTKNEQTPEMQKRFWRQVAMYLCSPRGNIWIATDKTTYDLRRLEAGSEYVEVTAGVEDPTGRPILDARPKAVLIDPEGNRSPLRLSPGKENLFGRLPLSKVKDTGVYEMEIEHTVEGMPLEARHRFEVTKRDLEAMDALANFDLLRRVARESDGEFVPLSALESLMEKLELATRPRKKTMSTRTDLAADYRWHLIAVLVSLMCIEWMIRKRKGLV
ncbi:MAG: glutamine amidotransferase [Phycisphaerae bacterium]